MPPAGASAELLPFLVQSDCLPWSCQGGPILHAGRALPWRKHDWPDARWRPTPPGGHQASDSLLTRFRGAEAVLQSFDFGDGPRRFGRFDAGDGDGGQVLVRTPEGWAIAMTEDGGNGVQWFQRPDCTPGGWLVAGATATAEWQEAVAPLHLRRRPDECPAVLDRSLTRWRVAPVTYPWRSPGLPGGRFTTDTLLSEHFSHPTREGSDHLERSWYARHLGLLRWERWERPGDTAQAASLAATRRCPEVAGSEAPAPGWRRVDCRMWTNFLPGPATPEPWPAAAQ